MSSNRKGKLVLYSGASGVGKGTILGEAMRRNPRLRLSVSNTTRKPREGETNGEHYNFVSREEFEDLISRGGYLEYAEYCGNLYGTPKQQVEELLEQGYDVLLEIEVQGGLQIMEQYPDVLSIFILPPSMSELESRLRNRGTEDEQTVQKRMEQAKTEMTMQNRYRHRVVNDDLETAVNEVEVRLSPCRDFLGKLTE